ncbi:MAG: ATP-binding protein [Fluviibacter sp.]
MLTLSSLESRASLEDEAEVAIYPLVIELIDAAEALSQGKHQISVDMPESLSIRGSASALRSIFGNLINNAVTYTPAGGEIRITWSGDGDEGRFSVTDTGIGIPQKHLPRLSERFYRVDQGRSRENGGTGLGLAIVKHALSRHQGRMIVASKENIGSTFEACFPISRISQSGQ